MIGILSQIKEGLDTKTHLYVYDNRFNDYEQAQIASVEINLRNKIAVVGCIPNLNIDLKELSEHIKLSVQTRGFKMNNEYKNIRIKIFVLGKIYNKYQKTFRFVGKDLVESFKS